MKTIRAVLSAALAACALAASAAPLPPSSYQDLRWRLLGPLRAGWSLCVEGVADELDTYYFGAADGGVWKTLDSGVTWQPISDSAPFSSVGALALATHGGSGGKQVIYVGSGQSQTRYDVMDGTGVYKSEDDGATWTSLGLADTLHIGRIWVDPRDPDVLLVAALGHLFGPNEERGVFRSADGGRSWSKVAFVDRDTGAVDLAADPGSPDVVYAAFWQTRRYPWQGYHVPQVGPGSGIHKSTDGGKSWAAVPRTGLPRDPLGRIGLAVAPGTGGRRIYASVDAPQDAGLYRSDDGGATWGYVNRDRSLTGTYFGHVFAHPRDADTVYAMGQSLRRSTDGGASFSFLKGTPGGDDYHFFWINPAHPERQALASDQGTTVTVNGGRTWSPWYNQPTGQFYRLGIDDRPIYRVYSGQQDSGTVSLASRSDYGRLTFRDWHPVGGDERDADLPDPEDPDIVFGSGLGGRISRWDARTGRVANVSPWPVSSYGRRPAGQRNRTTWITPIAIDPRPPHALYQGTQVLSRSLDKGQSWEAVSPDLTGARDDGCEGEPPVERATACGFGVIFAIAPSPAASGVVWVGTDNGRVQLTRDGGKSWQDVTPKGLPDWSQVAQIDASPRDPATAYAAIDRHRLDDRDPYIYVTHDHGSSWRRADAGLPRGAWVNVVREDPVRQGLLYAGTRNGVFVSFSDGESWQPLQLNLPRTGVNDLLVKGRDLVIATQGRAIWVLDDVTPLRFPDAVVPGPALAPPAPAVRLSANENRDTPLPPEFPALENPPAGAVIDYFLPTPPPARVRLEIVDLEGAVVRTFASDAPPARPEARQYFADRWLLPPAPPAARAGHNRYVWDLRHAQPKATEYSYSIAVAPGVDTPTLPQGSLVLPGRYTVRLTAGGVTLEQPLLVVPDPRNVTPIEHMYQQRALERDVLAALAETADALAAAPARDGETELAAVGDVLTALATDLEAADGPPTDPQRQVYRELRERLDRALAVRRRGTDPQGEKR